MIYFDAAATTLQKPPAVSRAAAAAIHRLSSPGRGGYESAEKAASVLLQCRMELAELFDTGDPERVAFTSNATHGLNIAIHSLVKPGDRVVISGYEHNAVTRPLHAIAGVTIRTVDAPLFDPDAMVRGFQKLVTRGTAAVVCTHVSNVFGYILPIEGIAAVCAKQGVPLIVDASQSAGTLPVSLRRLQAAFIAMPGHKGLYGPQGTGVLLCGQEGIPLLHGGTGSNSLDQQMPEFLPDRMEAGTHNVPGAAGLLEGVRFVRQLGIQQIFRHGQVLKEQLAAGIGAGGSYHVFAAADREQQTGVLSFTHRSLDPETVCSRLSQAGFALRGGYHCAPLAHRTAGTIESGTVRFSVSAFNGAREVEALTRLLRQW